MTSPYESVTVEIAGRVYQIKSKDDGSYLQNLAKMVNDRMAEVEKATRAVDSLRIADMTALNLADEYCKLKDRYEKRIQALDRERAKLQELIDNALKA